MPRVRLTRLNNHGNALRTPVVEGTLLSGLILGQEIWIEAEPLRAPLPALRYVITSPVVRIEGEDVRTKNTHYKVEILEDKE